MASNTEGNSSGRSNRGFAAMDPNEQRAIARKGGEAVSQDREHMAAIGRKGGEASGGGNRGRGQNAGTEDRSGLSAGSRSRDSEGQFGASASRNSSLSSSSSSRGLSGGMSAGGRDDR